MRAAIVCRAAFLAVWAEVMSKRVEVYNKNRRVAQRVRGALGRREWRKAEVPGKEMRTASPRMTVAIGVPRNHGDYESLQK